MNELLHNDRACVAPGLLRARAIGRHWRYFYAVPVAVQRRTHLKRSLAGSAALALPAVAQGRSVLIGQSVALSGPAAQFGIQMHAGAKKWIDQVNANGGINGQTIELRAGPEPHRRLLPRRRLREDGPRGHVELESVQRADFGGFMLAFGSRDHVASSYVDLSMLTGDGKVRR